MIRRVIIFILALIGLILSIKLTQVYINANFVVGAPPSFCTINNVINCDGVAQSQYSMIIGIPLSLWGIFLYLFLIFLTFIDKISNIKIFNFLKACKNPMDYVFDFSLLAFFISIGLGALSYFVIHKICTLCCGTYVVNGLIALTSGWGRNIFKSIKTGFEDLGKFLKDNFNKKLFAAAVVFFLIFVLLINQYEIFKPTRPDIQKAATPAILLVKGNTLGDENAKVVIHEYTDYMCPLCAVFNIQLHELVSNVDNVKIIHHHFPLDKECNRLLTSDFHIGSCLASRFAIAAKKQGKFWEYSSLLFDNNDEIFTEDKLIELGKQAGLNVHQLKHDAYSKEVEEDLQKDIEQAIKMGLNATPVFEINGRIYQALPEYSQLEELVLKNGGTLKKADYAHTHD